MKKFAVLATATFISFCFSFTALAQFRADIVAERPEDKFKQAFSNFTFNYFVKYLGPSLSPDMQDGSTFNRFKTGQDWKGDDTDFTGSEQTFQSFKLGYRLPKGMIVGYGVTFQDDLNEGIQYTSTNLDGSKNTQIREDGRSYNNHRVSLWIPGVYSNNVFFTGTTVYYELPTTDISKQNEMLYGFGVQPSLGFYSNTPGLFYGIRGSLERDVYKDHQYLPDWCKKSGSTCAGVAPTKHQTVRASVSPYLNYQLTDKVLLKSGLTFDWDQDGDQAGTVEFNKNMDDIGNIGAMYLFNNNLNVAAGVEASITNPDIDRTAVYGSLGINI